MSPYDCTEKFIAEQRAKWGADTAALILADVRDFLAGMPAHGRTYADRLLTDLAEIQWSPKVDYAATSADGVQAVSVQGDVTEPGRLMVGLRGGPEPPMLIVPIATWVAALQEYERTSGGIAVIRDER